ncbi:MAG TPA: 50S ribosomal protein L3 [Candidatus Cryosericum sp.]|jgi:large subunit ribosomal protein L3|nr:50S ribosomal protein L3 [Candidatus Cryosericum sp.]
MSKGILGKKVGMTSVFHEDKFVPATVIQAGPCYVVDVMTVERNGYEGVKLGYGEVRPSLVTKPEAGVFKKAGVPVMRHVREFRGMDGSVGQKVDLSVFDGVKALSITAVSKGKGYQGPVKRWHFAGWFKSHGSKGLRRVGAIGCRLTPGRVFKNHKMAGHMGCHVTTVKGIKVIAVDVEKNLLVVKGSIPGADNALLTIRA